MLIKAFRRDRDYEMLKEWWMAWGHPVADAEELSTTGFIVYEDKFHEAKNKPLLVGFMIMTNAKFVMIETVCANPISTIKERKEAIKELVRVVGVHAKALGFRRIIAFPQKKFLMEKGLEAGMRIDPSPCYLLTREIE